MSEPLTLFLCGDVMTGRGLDQALPHPSDPRIHEEVFEGKLILYGCGDFVNDYEGIAGHEVYRGDLSLAYMVAIAPTTGRLLSLRMKPMQMRRFRLNHASREDAGWLGDTLTRESRQFGAWVERDGELRLAWRAERAAGP